MRNRPSLPLLLLIAASAPARAEHPTVAEGAGSHPDPDSDPDPDPEATPATVTTETPGEVIIVVADPLPRAAASEEIVTREELAVQARRTPGQLLSAAPGLVVGQHAGGGKADQILLRGFDADHGTDVAVFVDGVPVNMPSHW